MCGSYIVLGTDPQGLRNIPKIPKRAQECHHDIDDILAQVLEGAGLTEREIKIPTHHPCGIASEGGIIPLLVNCSPFFVKF